METAHPMLINLHYSSQVVLTLGNASGIAYLLGWQHAASLLESKKA